MPDPQVHIVSDDGTTAHTLVTTVDGMPIMVSGITMSMDNSTRRWTAPLDFPFPKLDIVADVDTSIAWRNLRIAQARLNQIEAELRAIDEGAAT
jgi:hypothetical protein